MEQAITVRCDGYNGWNIRIDMNMMRTMYPNMRASHLYLGKNSCTGQNYGSYVMFRNSLGSCGSSQTVISLYALTRLSKYKTIHVMVNPILLLENINLILAFIITTISKPIKHLNISPAFIVYTNTEIHVVLYNTIDVYTAIMINWLSVA